APSRARSSSRTAGSAKPGPACRRRSRRWPPEPDEGNCRMNRLSASAVLLALAATICAPALRAQTPDALLSGFEPSGDWVLSVDGREVPTARLYFSKRAQAILIRSAEFPSPVLLDIAGRAAQTV